MRGTAVINKLGLTYMNEFAKRDPLHHLYGLERSAIAAPALKARA